MSKKSKTTAQAQPLTDNKRKAIIITAIILVAAIILTVALTLILRPSALTPADQNNSNSGSSTLTIHNGDFVFTSSDDTAYPKTAENWARKGYKAVSGDITSNSYTHDFADLTGTEQAVMGIVTTATDGDGDTWSTVAEDLTAAGITANNPSKHSTELGDDNVYMIATKEPTAAGILSDMFTVGSGKSVKITVWLNTEQIAEGSKAVVMLQKNNQNAKSENWYAYNFDVEKQAGWQELVFYIFNRDNSSKSLRMSVGLGNIYTGEKGIPTVSDSDSEDEKNEHAIYGEGVLFVDDITFEEVTANDYREVVDAEGASDSTSFKVIENEDIEEESEFLEWETLNGRETTNYDNAKTFADNEGGFSPFTNRDDFYKDVEKPDSDQEEDSDAPTAPEREETGFTITKLTHNGTIDGDKLDPIGFRLNANKVKLGAGSNNGINTEYSLWQKDYHHISFWVRVQQVNQVAKLNIYVQSYEDGEWKDVKDASWLDIDGVKDIETDSNCGWVKYDVYLKPDTNLHEISILVTLGNKDGYSKGALIPNGSLYITTPTYENISAKDYNNASSGTNAKKIDLKGDSFSPQISNGSFSSTGNNGDQPSSWTPVFAGDNALYRDGKGDDQIEGLHRTQEAVEYGVKRNFDQNHGHDDAQNNVLYINNKQETAFGYLSSTVTLSARTVYAFAFLAKGDPFFYILNNDTKDSDGNPIERADRVIASVDKNAQTLDAKYQQALKYDYTIEPLQNGWKCYFVVLVTGNESQTVRIALFNGTLDGSTLNSGEVYYDNINMNNLGTYSMVDDPDLEEGETAEKYVVSWNLDSNYQLDGEALTIKDLITGAQLKKLVELGAYTPEEDEEIGENPADGELSGLVQQFPSDEEWTEMLKVPEETESNDTETGEEETEPEREPVDLGLLFSVISSVALVAALLVVLVVKLFKNKKNQNKAA